MYEQIKQLLQDGETLAITTIVSTLGSTPREVGAKMVVTAAGEILGTIGGGCGEAEVRRRAVEAIRSRKPEMVKVELLDDIESDSPAVCGGVLDAFIDPWNGGNGGSGGSGDADIALKLAIELEEISKTGNAAVLASVLSADGFDDIAPGDKCLVRNGEVCRGNIRNQELQAAILKEAAVRQEREDCLRVALELSGGRKAEVFFEVMVAARRAVIVGAGHLAIPLVQFTKILGFHTTVLDDRVIYANRERFPNADEVLTGDMAETLGSLEITPQTYIVLITRGHQFDEPCLRAVIHSKAKYIGMIGSRRRVKACFIRFRDEEGISEELLNRVHAPIGLDIQAESPEEIALAIAAELVKVRRGGSAKSRKETM
ncbi:MAG: XdhC family protein [Acidobacteriota bacterium]|jgi:xanthine dehydrogenase accessory factor|nr:XdhC family protein [Acidobacteriota bacterium]